MRCYLASLITFLTISTSYAQTTLDKKGEAAGKYWGAIIMANEFKKTPCGMDLSLDSKWTNVTAAKQEIINSFPASVHQEINSAFSPQYEASNRDRFNQMFGKVSSNNCVEAQTIFYNLFDDAVTRWQAIKSQPFN